MSAIGSHVCRVVSCAALAVPIVLGVTPAYADPVRGGSPSLSATSSSSAPGVAASTDAPSTAQAATSSRASATAAARSRVTGVVYGDANHNGAFDPGEGLAGVTMTLSSESSGSVAPLTTTSDSSGGFRFADVPSGKYMLTGQARHRWNVIPQFITVRTGPVTHLRSRAVRPLNRALHATLTFDKHVYRVGNKARLTITLRNSGNAPLVGITAECNRIGDANQLTAGPTWGALASTGAGVTVPAGRRITVHVSSTVPRAARRYGSVVAACDFGYPYVDEGDRPQAHDVALVPGAFGAVAVSVSAYAHGLQGQGTGLADVKLVLVNTIGCPFIARGKTDAKGSFTFRHVAAGPYMLYIDPPTGWKVVFRDPTGALAFGTDMTHLSIQLVRGSASVPAIPTPPSIDCNTSKPTPVPPRTNDNPVAATGADAGALVEIGLVLAFTGLGVTVTGARRRQP